MAKKDLKIYNVGDKLTTRQAKWIDYILMGNTQLDATRKAGYKGNTNTLNQIGIENSIKFAKLLEPRLKEVENERTMELQEILEFWSDTIRDSDIKLFDRIKCSELLARAKGGFVERSITTNITNTAFKELSVDELRRLIK